MVNGQDYSLIGQHPPRAGMWIAMPVQYLGVSKQEYANGHTLFRFLSVARRV
jgi:hypothetical protein